jgi:hypothetical protein
MRLRDAERSTERWLEAIDDMSATRLASLSFFA